MLSGPFIWIIVTACLIVFGVLMVGVIGFARGGEFNRKYANKIMQLRLLMQFLAVILIVLLAFLARNLG